MEGIGLGPNFLDNNGWWWDGGHYQKGMLDAFIQCSFRTIVLWSHCHVLSQYIPLSERGIKGASPARHGSTPSTQLLHITFRLATQFSQISYIPLKSFLSVLLLLVCVLIKVSAFSSSTSMVYIFPLITTWSVSLYTKMEHYLPSLFWWREYCHENSNSFIPPFITMQIYLTFFFGDSSSSLLIHQTYHGGGRPKT